MSFESSIEHVVRAVEALGAGIMVVGGAIALVRYLGRLRDRTSRSGAYQLLRRELGRVILLGLEVLIVGDIIRTIVVDATLESVAVLGGIVAIRIALSFSLEVEIDGAWPWARARGTSSGAGSGADPPQ